MNKIAFLLLALLLTGCQSTRITKQDAFPKVYAEKPASILVVPAVNNTTAADASQLYATTIAYPLAEAGYYVFSIPYIDSFFAAEGVTDGAQLRQVPMSKFRETFGADSVLFVNINKWDTNYYLTGGSVAVAAHFELVSTKSNELIWQYDDVIVKDTSSDSGNLFADLISTALSTAMSDYVPMAKTVNQQILRTIPVGKYHKKHGKDQDDSGISLERAQRGQVNEDAQ